MKYEMMYPDQVRKAIDENWPVVLPAGVLEYHSEHCVLGVDTLLVIKGIEELEKEMDMVVLPPFYYGAASYVVESPEKRGTVHVGPEAIHPLVKELFTSLLRTGFRNIHVFIHHQSENFTAGMPTDLAFKLAGRQAIFDKLNRDKGEGWWGSNDMEKYYENVNADNPFNWIQVHPFMSAEVQAEYPIDHAGKQESSLMMAFCPEGIDMKRHDDSKWYSKAAKEASIDYGNRAKEATLKAIRKILQGE